MNITQMYNFKSFSHCQANSQNFLRTRLWSTERPENTKIKKLRDL